MSRKKTEFIVPDLRPRLDVTESVSLSLVRDGRLSIGGHFFYHQTATTEDLENFIRETTRRFGHPRRIDIGHGSISASRSESK